MALASLRWIEPQMAAIRILPRLCFSSLLLQSASKSTIDFYLSHTPSPSGGAIARSMSSSSSFDALSPATYTTLSKRATCEREIKKSKFIAIDFSCYLTLGDTRCATTNSTLIPLLLHTVRSALRRSTPLRAPPRSSPLPFPSPTLRITSKP